MAKKTLEPQQARSRESTRKLLKAAAEVLGQHGLEGTTIPRIAQHAGLTPGAVYRRFPDKDALLEAVVIGILERQDERLRMALTPDMARQIPLPLQKAAAHRLRQRDLRQVHGNRGGGYRRVLVPSPQDANELRRRDNPANPQTRKRVRLG